MLQRLARAIHSLKKPVGTVYIALADERGTEHRKQKLPGS